MTVVLITGALAGIGRAGGEERKNALVAGVPMKRLGQPDDIVDVIAFLASPQAGFLTGQVIDVNGGKTAS
jgi:NAD(P)-dependent dehydrogenase (short-subunit alcohol dehydrogenase family)